MYVEQNIKSDSLVGIETTQTVFSDSVVLTTVEQTIVSDGLVGQETVQLLTADTKITAPIEQTIDANSHILVQTTQVLLSDTHITEPVILFGSATVDKLIEDDKEVEKDASNPVPATPVSLVAIDIGVGDSINLSWSSSAKFFNVYRKDPGPVFVKLNPILLENVTSYQAGGLATGIAVTFIIRAVNGLGQESSNSNEATATPTLNTNLERFSKPTYTILINGSPRTDAILNSVNLAFGSNFSTATFILPQDFRGTGPSIGSTVEISINGKLVFKGKISTRGDLLDIGGGLRISYTCDSNITDLTLSTLFDTTVDSNTTIFNRVEKLPDGKIRILNEATANKIVSTLGVGGTPEIFPGLVNITDLTPLGAAELVLQKIGNYKVFHDMATGTNSAYQFGSKGFTVRAFSFGDAAAGGNIVSYNVQISNQDVIKTIRVIGAPRQVRVKRALADVKVGIDPDGRRRLIVTIKGKNIRDIQVFGFSREKPVVRFNEEVQVTLEDMGFESLSSTNSSFKLESSFFGTSVTTEDSKDAALRPIITTVKIFRSTRRSVGAKMFFTGKDSVTISINSVPKKWFHVTKTGSVALSKIGLEGDGEKTVRVLLGYDFFPGNMEVEFTVDSNRPLVVAGSGSPSKSITDGQFAIITDSIIGFSNAADILTRMNARAANELVRLNKENISGTITVLGDETIDLRSSVDVNGLLLEISGVTHSFVGGFKTTVELTNEPFFRNIIVRPVGFPRPKEAEKSRRLFFEDFADRELAEADNSKDRANETEGKDQDSVERGPFSVYQD